jgi:hypothetical protein
MSQRQHLIFPACMKTALEMVRLYCDIKSHSCCCYRMHASSSSRLSLPTMAANDVHIMILLVDVVDTAPTCILASVVDRTTHRTTHG